MVKGISPTSKIISISGLTLETAENTFTDEQVLLDLDPLNQEVFVVTNVAIDIDEPDLIADTTTLVDCSLSKTEQTSVNGINSDNVIASSRTSIVLGQIGFSRDAPNLAAAEGDYLSLIHI